MMEEEKIENYFEAKKTEFLRRGEKDKVKYLDNLRKIVLPSQLRRIQQNDKTVLMELVVPKWLGWDLLYEWASQLKARERGSRLCILCNESNAAGIDFREKWICDNCFVRVKSL